MSTENLVVIGVGMVASIGISIMAYKQYKIYKSRKSSIESYKS